MPLGYPIILANLYKLGGIRAVRSAIENAVLTFSHVENLEFIPYRRHALRYGKLFCDSFLLATEAQRVGPKNVRVEMDSDRIRISATLLKALKKEDFEKYEEEVRKIRDLLVCIEEGGSLNKEEVKRSVKKLNELYDLFNERIFNEERQLIVITSRSP